MEVFKFERSKYKTFIQSDLSLLQEDSSNFTAF